MKYLPNSFPIRYAIVAHSQVNDVNKHHEEVLYRQLTSWLMKNPITVPSLNPQYGFYNLRHYGVAASSIARLNPEKKWWITKDEYDKKATQLKHRQHELDLKQQQYTHADEDFSITVSYLLNISAQAHSLFAKAEPEEKRQVLSFVFSNLLLDGKKLQYELKKPFDAVLTAGKSQAWLPKSDYVRTKISGLSRTIVPLPTLSTVSD